MPTNEKYLQKLEPEVFYHIYNRTNNSELLFKSDKNRLYFLKKYAVYLSGYLKTYAYCLMDNHFHLLVQVRSEQDIITTIKNTAIENRLAIHKKVLEQTNVNIDFPAIINKQFNRWFTVYAMAFNRHQNRKGNLFHRPFKRLKVKDNFYLSQLIYYIHANPVLHKVRKKFTDYQWSSYQSFLSEKPTLLEREAVLNWFGDKVEFIQFHNTQHCFTGIECLDIERDY